MSTIRRQISIEASPRAIWAALTTAEGLKSWLADEATVIASVAGRFSITVEGDDGPPVGLELRGVKGDLLGTDPGTFRPGRPHPVELEIDHLGGDRPA